MTGSLSGNVQQEEKSYVTYKIGNWFFGNDSLNDSFKIILARNKKKKTGLAKRKNECRVELRNYIYMRVYCTKIKNLFQSLRLKFLGNFHNLSSIWNNRFSIFLFTETAWNRDGSVWFPDRCKTGKTGESSIIRVGSQYVTNVSVKGKVDKKSEDLWLPASRYLAFSFLPRREVFMNLKLYRLLAKPAPLQFRPRTGVPAKTLAALTRFTLGDSWHSSNLNSNSEETF